MGRIKGERVILIDRVKTGEDPFGAATYEEKEIPVDNVLIAPTSSEDAATELDLSGRKAVYTLAIPKGDQHQWGGKKVIFFGERFRVIGEPLSGMDALIPLDWNKKVRVERYDG